MTYSRPIASVQWRKHTNVIKTLASAPKFQSLKVWLVDKILAYSQPSLDVSDYSDLPPQPLSQKFDGVSNIFYQQLDITRRFGWKEDEEMQRAL
jgi:hypothetical protein